MTEKRKHGAAVRFLCTFLSVLMLIALLPSASAVSAASLKLNYTSISLTKGYKATLKATGAGSVKWSSSNSAVASVTSSGKVYGKSAGTAYITAKSGSLSAKCKVKVVNGKLKLSQATINIEEGESEIITVNATGSHGLKAQSDDKTIAKASWVKPWSGNDISLRITGVSAGTTRIKVLMSSYTEVYKYITVNVDAAEQDIEDEKIIEEEDEPTSHIMTDKASLSVEKGASATFKVYTNKKENISASSSDSTVIALSAPVWTDTADGFSAVYTVTGIKTGAASVTISASDNSSLARTVYVTVISNGEYYEVCDTEPRKKTVTDIMLTWTEDSRTKYMLVPSSYDPAHTNTLIARSSQKYSYYTVYEDKPEKADDKDTISSFNYTIGGTSVVRYVLLPEKYDTIKNQTLVASYTKKYQYWIIYNEKPLVTASDDVIKQWTASVDGKLVTRYVLLPYGYSEARFEDIKKSDTAMTSGYYTITTDQSLFDKKDTDTVERITYIDSGVAKIAYILLPKDYDQARRDTAVAEYTGQYEYYMIYTASPKQLISTDIIESWKKVVNGEVSVRYILLPAGYSKADYERIKSEDLANGADVYYTVYTSYPTNVLNVSAGDTVFTWTNPKSSTKRYMILPAGYNVVKRNDAVYNDTGVYEYYNIYSTKPSVKTDKDTVRSGYDAVYGTYYMLLPENYLPENIEKAINGTYFGA